MEDREIISFEDTEDFDADKIFDCGQCFRWNRREDGSWLGVVGGALLRVQNKRVYVAGGTAEKAALLRYFDAERDYAKIRAELSARDPILARACDCGKGIRILNQDPWETLISFIVSQNNNIPRIKKCVEGLCKSFGEKLCTYEGEDFYAFPAIDSLTAAGEESLAPIHLGYRSRYIAESAKETAADGGRALHGCVKADEKAAFEYLRGLCGVGPKVANCILLFSMEKQESFPIDVWVRRVMNKLYGIDEGDLRSMESYARRNFSPYGGIAQQYLFYYAKWGKFDGGDI